jgi:hypothetical protein
MAKSKPTPIARFRESLDHDRETGVLRWRVRPLSHFPSARTCNAWNARFAGKIAGCHHNGYIRIRVFDRAFMAHCIVWALETGQWPQYEIDHKNRNRSDNRFDNLRPATSTLQQMQNKSIYKTNKSGTTGVWYNAIRQQWTAYISAGGRRYHLGYFDTQEDAVAARLMAKKELHPFTPSSP